MLRNENVSSRSKMRSKLSLTFVFSMMIFVSCNKGGSRHLSSEKMQLVLSDVHLAESYSIIVNQDSAHQFNTRNLDSLAVYYKTIFKHHNITPEEFEQSLNWYRENPAELDSLYQKIIPEMTRLEGIYSTQ